MIGGEPYIQAIKKVEPLYRFLGNPSEINQGNELYFLENFREAFKVIHDTGSLLGVRIDIHFAEPERNLRSSVECLAWPIEDSHQRSEWRVPISQ